MRLMLALLLLAGCASNDYSQVPEPSGEWVPANLPSLAAPPVQATALLMRRGGL